MSRWLFRRFALSGLLTASLAVPVQAQPSPVPASPESVAIPATTPVAAPTRPTVFVTQQPAQQLHIIPVNVANPDANSFAVVVAAVEGIGPAIDQTWDFLVVAQAPALPTAVKHTTENGQFSYEIVLPKSTTCASHKPRRTLTCTTMGCMIPQCSPTTLSVNGIAASGNREYRPGMGVRAVMMSIPVLAPRLSGTWFREKPGSVYSITFRSDELKITQTANLNGTLATLTMTADYAVTKDGTVHGVITGADVDVGAGTDPTSMDLANLSLKVQSVVDQPFALRCRPVEGGLMMSNIRIASRGDVCPEEMFTPGIYKSTCPNKSLPTPQAVLPPVPDLTALNPVFLPSPQYLKHFPAYYSPDLMVPALPSGPVVKCLPPDCPMLPDARAIGVSGSVVPSYLPPPAVCPTGACPNSVKVIDFTVPPMPPPISNQAVTAFPSFVEEFCAVAHNACQATSTSAQPVKMTLADVVELARAGVREDVIVNQLRNTSSTFHLTVDDIKYLKANGVSDQVILALQQK